MFYFSAQKNRIYCKYLIGHVDGSMWIWQPVPGIVCGLPREADRIISGNCGVVAIWVTHPLWPFSVPLTVICSVILHKFHNNLTGRWSRIAPESWILSAPLNLWQKEKDTSHRKHKLWARSSSFVIAESCIAHVSPPGVQMWSYTSFIFTLTYSSCLKCAFTLPVNRSAFHKQAFFFFGKLYLPTLFHHIILYYGLQKGYNHK